MLFSELAHVLHVIEGISQRKEIIILFAELLSKSSPEEAAIIVNFALGQLYPVYKGINFFIGEKVIFEVLARLLSLSTDCIAQKTQKLTYLDPVFSTSDSFVSQNYDIETVFKKLVTLTLIDGVGSTERKVSYLADFLHDLDSLSADFMVRIILGKLRLGFSHMTILDALALAYGKSKQIRRDLEHAYAVSADLGGLTFFVKKHGIDSLYNIKIIVGIPIVVAAAERVATIDEILERINPVVLQPKFDGMRVQIHAQWFADGTSNISIFSRHLHEITHMFPEIVAVLKEYRGTWSSIIFEGEVVAYDINTTSLLPFQETAKRKRKHNVDRAAEEIPLKMFAFDALYSNQNSLLAVYHQRRRAELAAFIESLGKQEIIALIDECIVDSLNFLESFFYTQIEAGLEGIIAKRLDAPYTPGKRNFNWIKFKKAHSAHLQDSIDAVVLGYYHGKGKRANLGLGALLVGIFNPSHDTFETIAKVGTGLSDVQLKEFKKLFDSLQVETKPYNVICHRQLYPDVWIVPSLVVVVQADEISLSSMHSCGMADSAKKLGYGLRFPRFIQIAEDKDTNTATTLDEIQSLYNKQAAS